MKFIFNFFFILIYFQCNSQTLDLFLDHKFIEIESTWDERGFWGDALQNKDNRYNEAILFYLSCEKKEVSYYETRILKAIKFSIEHFQLENGAFMHEGQQSHIRTSLFLYAIAKVGLKYPILFEEIDIVNSINKAVNWLKAPHKFASNHNIAAMLALKTLYQVTKKSYYLDLHLFYRKLIINSYNTKGYWPEAPKDWSNRLNIPYLFVQSFLIEEYLLYNKDEKIKILYQNLVFFMFNRIDVKNCKVDVTESIGNFSSKGISSLNFSVASFFWSSRLKFKSDNFNKEQIIKKCISNFNYETKDSFILNYTDIYYRFAIIESLKK